MCIMAHSKMAQTVVSALILFSAQNSEMDRPNAPKPSRKKLRVCNELRDGPGTVLVFLSVSRFTN